MKDGIHAKSTVRSFNIDFHPRWGGGGGYSTNYWEPIHHKQDKRWSSRPPLVFFMIITLNFKMIFRDWSPLDIVRLWEI